MRPEQSHGNLSFKSLGSMLGNFSLNLQRSFGRGCPNRQNHNQGQVLVHADLLVGFGGFLEVFGGFLAVFGGFLEVFGGFLVPMVVFCQAEFSIRTYTVRKSNK